MTLGAGVQWFEAYDAVEAHGRVLVGGISVGGTVGAAGGWVLGGGHSILSPQHGLGSLESPHNINSLYSSILFRSGQCYRVQYCHLEWQLSHRQLSSTLRSILGFTWWRRRHLRRRDIRDVQNTSFRPADCRHLPLDLFELIYHKEAPH
jgi:hypothetical protein